MFLAARAQAFHFRIDYDCIDVGKTPEQLQTLIRSISVDDWCFADSKRTLRVESVWLGSDSMMRNAGRC